MIEVEHLTKYYGAFPAVRDVSFEVDRGEILGFLGPNGAGKTTTMRMITGYIPPTAGRVRVAGLDVSEKSLEARKHLGYLPETVPLYTELTPAEYLDFKGRISGMHSARERRARMGEIMDILNIQDVSNKLIGALSRGYRQRVGLAQAMLHNPDVLIMDEPTVGLDPVQITEVRQLIRDLGENHTIILSTHLLPEVSMVCNRVIIIHRGRLVALDTPFHLAAETMVPEVVVEVAGDRELILSALQSVPGVVSAVPELPTSVDGVADAGTFRLNVQEGADVRAGVAEAVVLGGHRLLELRTERPSLEEVFLRVISQETEEDDLGQEREDLIEVTEGIDDLDTAADEGGDVGELDTAGEATKRVVARRRVRR